MGIKEFRDCGNKQMQIVDFGPSEMHYHISRGKIEELRNYRSREGDGRQIMGSGYPEI